MKYAFDNANPIDGTQDMRVQPGQCVLTDGETITDIVPAGTAPDGYRRSPASARMSPAQTENRSPAKPDAEILRLFQERGAFLCATFSPALPYARFDRAVTHLTEDEQFNGRVVFDGMIDCAKAALEHGIPVVLGNDTSCQWVAQYAFWRELCYFHEYAGASNACTLYCATGQSARMAGLGDVTGTLRPGLCADMLVTSENPLEDLRALRTLDMVVARGRIIDRPRPKRNARLDAGLDTLLT